MSPSRARTSWRVPTLSVAALLTGFVTLRWLFAAHHQISRFVVAGSSFANSLAVPPYLHVFQGSTGYDGQFYWRLALNPTHLSLGPYLGINLDSAARLNRLVYPALAWLVSGGDRALVSWSLVVVNILALLVLARLGIAQANANNLSSWWGLSILLVPGLIGALSRDLTEILSVTFFISAVFVSRRSWWVATGGFFALALLTRESLLLPIAVFALVQIVLSLRERRPFHPRLWSWLLPFAALLGWQLVLFSVVHKAPLFGAAQNNLGAPFAGMVTSVDRWFEPFGLRQLVKGLIIVTQVFSFFALAILAWRHRPSKRPTELGLFLATFVLVICENLNGWRPPFDMRYGVDTMVLAWLFLLESPDASTRRRALWLVAPSVALTVVLRIVVI